MLYKCYNRSVLRLIHTPQEQINVFVFSRWQEQEQSLFWPGHFILHEKLKCRSPGKSSKGPPTAAHVTGAKHSAPVESALTTPTSITLTNHTIVLRHDTRQMFCLDDVSRTSCENSRTRAARKKLRHFFLAALGERTNVSVLAEYVSAFTLTLCKSLWIKASAKCPKCKCKYLTMGTVFLMYSSL